jgi:hypothetical protein
MICTAPECRTRLQYDNKTGLCIEHYIEMKAAHLPKCSQCAKRIQQGNKTGKCQFCLIMERRAKARRYACAGCGVAVSKSSKGGRCIACASIARYPNARACGHVGCGQPISQKNKSGLCHVHKASLAGPVITEKLMITVRQVGKALGIDPRDILGRSRFPEVVEARACVALLLRRQGMSYNRIGERLGRDHSSIMSLVRRAPEYAARSERFAGFMERAA